MSTQITKNEAETVGRTAAKHTTAVLRQLKTWKRIAEGWPEIVPLIPKEIADRLAKGNEAAQLPVRLSDLNAQLDLPPDEQEAAE